MKRMNKSTGWVLAINTSLSADTNRTSFQAILPNRKISFVDGTHTTEPDGSYWRVHYQFSAESLGCSFYSLTKSDEAESFTHFPVHAGDLLLGDRAYCKAQGIRHVVDGGADALVRLHLTALPLWDENGQRISLLPWLRMINQGEIHERVAIINSASGPIQGRICTKRLSLADEMKSKRRIKKAGKKKQKKARCKAIEYGGYICVFTTVKADELSAENALKLYRARWQVEIAFKRLKSLLKFGSVPKNNSQAAIVWINLKFLLAFIIKRYVASIRSSLVTKKGEQQKSLWRVLVEGRDALFQLITMPIRMDQLLSMHELIATAHSSPPRRRQSQLDELSHSLAA